MMVNRISVRGGGVADEEDDIIKRPENCCYRGSISQK